MSKVKVSPPTIIHTPSFKRWEVARSYVVDTVRALGFELMYPGVHLTYWYTDKAGVEVLLPDLILNSELYKESVFTCINYSFKTWNEASQRYKLNTWLPIIGKLAGRSNRHAWNLILVGDNTGLHTEEFLFFEPNGGWAFGTDIELAYQAFPLGEEGYNGELLFV